MARPGHIARQAILPRVATGKVTSKGLFGKWRIQVDGRGLKGILGNFDL
jgi:hypothetical protein